eukprot:RCo015298
MADPMSVEARLPRRNSLDSLATALQNTPPIASTVSTFEIPQSLTLDAITHPVLACGTPEAEETALPAPPLDSFIISETTSSFTPIPEGLLEATFMECLRRCGWGVTAHQLSPPGAEFQCFCSHTFW